MQIDADDLLAASRDAMQLPLELDIVEATDAVIAKGKRLSTSFTDYRRNEKWDGAM